MGGGKSRPMNGGNKMGYESKLYIVERSEHDNFILGEVIATYDLCKMMFDGWRELFKTPIDFTIYADDGNTHITEDWYGDVLKYAPFEDVKEYIGNLMKKNDYRRLAPFYGLLNGFDESKWRQLVVVHFGH